MADINNTFFYQTLLETLQMAIDRVNSDKLNIIQMKELKNQIRELSISPDVILTLNRLTETQQIEIRDTFNSFFRIIERKINSLEMYNMILPILCIIIIILVIYLIIKYKKTILFF